MRACARCLQCSHFNRVLAGPSFHRRADSVLPQFFQARVARASTVASRCQCYFVPSAKIRCISAASLRETAARRRPGAPQCRTPKVGWLAENDLKPWRKDMWGIPQINSLAGTRNSPMLCASPSSWHRSRTSAGSSTPSSPSQGRKPCSHRSRIPRAEPRAEADKIKTALGIAEVNRRAGLFVVPAVRVGSRSLTNQIAWASAKAEASQQRLQHTGCRQILHRQLHTRAD